jgi:hypothetical protein
MMNARSLLAAGLAVLLLGPPAFGQTLVEAAKKEKERREALKGKTTVPVTNADLSQVKKKPAAEGPKAEPPKEEKGTQASPNATAAPVVQPVSPPLGTAPGEGEGREKEALTKYDEAKKTLDALTVQLQTLWQQYYSFNSMISKEKVKRDIAETSLKLQAATAEEAKCRAELKRLGLQLPSTVLR